MKKIITIAILAISINAFAQIPTNGLVGYWPFNGNANDESGNGNNGFVNGPTLTTDKFGNPNSSYSFDGINDYIMVDDKDNLSLTSNNFTFSFWIYVNIGTNVNMGAIAKRKFDGMDASSWEYTFGVDANPNEFRCWFGNLQGNCGPYVSPVDVTFTKGQWIHYVITANGTTIKFYKNGQLLSEGSRSQTCDFGNGSGPLLFGLGGGWNQMYYLNGKMDEIRIYNRVLSQSEILAIYNKNMCSDTSINITTVYHVSDAGFESISPKIYLESIDSLSSSTGGCDSIIKHYSKYVYLANYFTDTISVNDTTWINDTINTIVYDTTFRTIYDTIAVTDTLVINANFTSFNPVKYANTVKIYPNPTRDKITIDCGSNYSTMNGYKIQITNSLSQTVYTSLINQQSTTLDLSKWKGKGLYFVHLIDGTGNTVDIKKIVLQ